MLVIDKTCLGLIISYLLFSLFFSKFLLFHVVGPISTNISFNDKNILTTCVITANILLWNALCLCGRLRNWSKSVHLSQCFRSQSHIYQKILLLNKEALQSTTVRLFTFVVKILSEGMKIDQRTLISSKVCLRFAAKLTLHVQSHITMTSCMAVPRNLWHGQVTN